MKVLLIALFVAAAAAIPVPDEDSGPVDVIVNGVPEGQPLDIGHIVDIKLNEHANGQVVASSDLLHPFTAVGIAEAAAAEAPAADAAADNDVAAIVLPEPVAPEVVPEPIQLPAPVAPEVVPEPIQLPAPVAPEVVPEPIQLPAPVAPEVVPEPIELPAPVAPEVAEEVPAPAAQFPNGQIFNDGVVQVTMNGPQEPGMLSTIQGWFNMVLNYFGEGVQTTHQIV